MRIYDQSLLCCPTNCPVIDREGDKYTLHDPAYPGQGKIRFGSKDELRIAFDAAVATGSLTVHHPVTDETYSFKDHPEMQLFAKNAFAALEATA